MTGFKVETIEPIELSRTGRLASMYVLSPFVWAKDGTFHLLLRAVPRRDDEPRLKMAEIWHGKSDNGLQFTMDEGPCLFPGPDPADLDGCEDPTVILAEGRTHVWYTGWNHRQKTGRLLKAEGPDPRRLSKRGVALPSTAAFANPKEATVVRGGGGDWRLFFEYARDEASRLGVATSNGIEGPWRPTESALVRREGAWDDWHLSPGPIIGERSDHPAMFYNGATRDAHWRIGWAVFDRDFREVMERCDDPLIVPAARDGTKTDIAFAASAVESGDRIWLYYSISDQMILRATVRHR